MAGKRPALPNFPVDYEGNILARSWVISLRHPQTWLNHVIEARNFTPRQWPETMTPQEVQRAVANTLCPRSAWGTTGVSVSCELTKAMQTVCHVVYYSADPINWWDMKAIVYHSAHIEPARAPTSALLRFLEMGGKGTKVVAPPLSLGLPIGDNLSLTNKNGM